MGKGGGLVGEKRGNDVFWWERRRIKFI